MAFAASVSTRAADVDLKFPIEIKGGHAVRERLKRDLLVLTDAVKDPKLEESARTPVERSIAELGAEVEKVPGELPAGFRTIMPFSDLQARIFAVNSRVLRARGFPALSAWVQNRWDPLFPMQAPPAGTPAGLSLSVSMMRREHRAEAFQLTNATDNPISASLNLHDLPGGTNPDWVSVSEVQFTDTYIHYPIAAALTPAGRTPSGYAINIPAGMTRQIWLEFRPTDQEAGSHRGRIQISADGVEPIGIPLHVKLYPFRLPEPLSIAVGGWDYTQHPETAFHGTLVDQRAFIKFLRDYGVNTPWARGRFLFEGCAFDADGHMTRGPDFTVWDQWIAKWPGAGDYAVFFDVGDNFDGEKMATARFKRMVGEWITAIADHARLQGIAPKQILALLVDEPIKPRQVEINNAWADAIKASQPEIVIWSNPCFEDNSLAAPHYFEVVDVVCPSLTKFVDSPQSYRDFFIHQRRAGQDLMFYACVNGKHLDPITYHRGQFWLAIRYGGKGSFFWAFGDEGGAPGSFQAYNSPGHMFSPFFLDRRMGIVDGKHMQAIREGAEDYEYFQMLRRRIASLESNGFKSPALEAAKKLFLAGPERATCDIVVPKIEWISDKDRSVMDEVRVEVLEALLALEGAKP